MKNNKGITLIELIIAFALLALVGVAATGLLGTGSRLFSSNTKEIDLQTEAQSAFNHLNNFIVDVQKGLNFTEGSGDDDNVLEIINTTNVYYIKWEKADKELYFAEVPISTPATVPTDDDYELLATNVEEFKADLSDVETKNKIEINLKLAYNDKEYIAQQAYALRNDIKKDTALEELVAEDPSEFVSYVTSIEISEAIQYCAKGQTYGMSALVKGQGFPIQSVTWAVEGSNVVLPDPSVTNPDITEITDTGELHISEFETSDELTIKATTKGLDVNKQPMVDDKTVKIIELTGVETTYLESNAMIGKVLRVDGNPIMSPPDPNMSSDAFQVSFRLPTEDDVDKYPELNPENYKGVGVEGLDIYQSSSMTNCCDLYLGAEMENSGLFASGVNQTVIYVLASSPLDTSKEFLKPITIKKSDLKGLDISGNLTVNRGAEAALSAQLEKEGVTSREVKITWAITNDAGLGDKVSINSDTGLLKVAKNIDYKRSFELEITATAKTIDSSKEIKTTVKVVIPQVTISLPIETLVINQGTSDRISYLVNGLKVEAGDVICSSKPSMKNTLMYCTANECVISVGKNESNKMTTVNVMLNADPSISSAINVYILQAAKFHNVEGRNGIYASYYTPDEVGSRGKTEETTDGSSTVKLVYSTEYVMEDGEYALDEKGNRVKKTVLTVGKTSYDYSANTVQNGISGWWIPRSNVEGKDYYIPVPGLAADLPNEITYKYMMNYKLLLLTYEPGTYVTVSNSDGTKDKFQLSGEGWIVAK